MWCKKITLDDINENSFLISDHHFGCSHINKYEPSRRSTSLSSGYGDNIERMMIDKWNSVIGEDDLIIYLGDFAINFAEKYHRKLKGHTVLILGNHDKRPVSFYQSLFDLVISGLHIEELGKYEIHSLNQDNLYSGVIKNILGKKILFSHYPVMSDNPYDLKNERIANRIIEMRKFYKNLKCDVNVHGHKHSKVIGLDNHFNVSCEALDFVPIQLRDILYKI